MKTYWLIENTLPDRKKTRIPAEGGRVQILKAKDGLWEDFYYVGRFWELSLAEILDIVTFPIPNTTIQLVEM